MYQPGPCRDWLRSGSETEFEPRMFPPTISSYLDPPFSGPICDESKSSFVGTNIFAVPLSTESSEFLKDSYRQRCCVFNTCRHFYDRLVVVEPDKSPDEWCRAVHSTNQKEEPCVFVRESDVAFTSKVDDLLTQDGMSEVDHYYAESCCDCSTTDVERESAPPSNDVAFVSEDAFDKLDKAKTKKK